MSEVPPEKNLVKIRRIAVFVVPYARYQYFTAHKTGKNSNLPILQQQK